MEVGGEDAWGCEGHGGCGVLLKEWCTVENECFWWISVRERDCVVSVDQVGLDRGKSNGQANVKVNEALAQADNTQQGGLDLQVVSVNATRAKGRQAVYAKRTRSTWR
jgi:hypothetical protein